VLLLLTILFAQPTESHFFKWLWNKVHHALNPTETKRSFDCGISDVPQILPSKSDSPRITGGLSAADHSYPWVVNVINIKSLKSCGGAIVSPDTVITAAHCIVDAPIFLTVIAGASNLFGRLNLFNYHAVSSVFIHPNYVSCCDNDLAIIKLKKTLERSDMINSICLPLKQNEQLKPETMAIIAGWGGKYPSGELNTFGSFSLKQGIVYIKSSDYCKNIFVLFDENDEICATNINDHVDAREGDSGGPLMIRNMTDNRWYLYGVTSHGANTATIKPGVYSSISAKLDFIKQHL